MEKKFCIGVAIVVLVLISMATTVYADSSVTVKVGNPFSTPPDLGAKGITSNGHYVGEIPVTIISGSNSYPALAYCQNYAGTIYVGSTYAAQLTTPPDNAAWKAIAYILTWYAPPLDNTAAATNAVAIWRLLDSNYVNPLGIDNVINSAGINLANNIALGKDVVRQGDSLSWVQPTGGSAYANPGSSVTFQVRLIDSNGNPRSNVKLVFSAQLAGVPLDLSYINPLEAFTNSLGIAQFAVTVPISASPGAQVTVHASSTGVWPQQFLDLNSGSGGLQDLIAMDTPLQLTTSTTIYVEGTIFVLPESPLGVLSAIGAFSAAFVCWQKLRPNKKLQNG